MWLYNGWTWGHALYIIGLEGLKALAPFAAGGLAVWLAARSQLFRASADNGFALVVHAPR